MFVVNVLDHLSSDSLAFDTPPKSGATTKVRSANRVYLPLYCVEILYRSKSGTPASLLVINITTASWAHLEKMVIGASRIAVLCNFYILAFETRTRVRAGQLDALNEIKLKVSTLKF